MGRICCISGCRSESYAGSGISFHGFPKNPDLKQMWVKTIPTTRKITKNSFVCSHHFRPEDFDYRNGRSCLTHKAVPSIFMIKNANNEYEIMKVESEENFDESSEDEKDDPINKDVSTQTTNNNQPYDSLTTRVKLYSGRIEKADRHITELTNTLLKLKRELIKIIKS